MMVFEIFQMFLLPGVFIFVLLISGLVFFVLRKKIGKILIIAAIIFYYFFSISPVADLVISPLENQYKNKEQRLSDVENIVLLIGGVKKGDLPISSKLGESSLFRTVKAVEIYFQAEHKPTIIISGSDPISSSSRPAEEIAKFIQSFNVSKENILLEEKSKNSYQSAKEIKKIIGDESFILITSAYHLPRSVYIFRKMGLDPIPVPADFKAEENYNILDLFPDPRNLKKCDLAFHEYFGLLYYHLR